MFEIFYEIVCDEVDDFVGQNGFLQIRCNEFQYGEIYPKEIADIMDRDALFDWMERLIRVLIYLKTYNYVVLSDVESYNTWLEFKRDNDDLIVSVIEAEKNIGSKDIEFSVSNRKNGEWYGQRIHFNEFERELNIKVGNYIKYIKENNAINNDIESLQKKYDSIF